MERADFDYRLELLMNQQEELLVNMNEKTGPGNGIVNRYVNPVLTAAHTPIFWRYDLNYETNPHLLERLGINAVFNCGAMEFEGKFVLAVRVEGADRKSFFAIAESHNGIDNFRFWDYPILMPETAVPDVNVYDMRLVRHEDGGSWIVLYRTQGSQGRSFRCYRSMCIARTKDLIDWERLPDLKRVHRSNGTLCCIPSLLAANMHSTHVHRMTLLKRDRGGIGWGVCSNIEAAEIDKEVIIDRREYHTIKEVKNGLGPAPFKTKRGWLHLAHGVRGTAAGLRYVLYLFLCDLNEPWRMIHQPGGYFLAPEGDERVGDVSNVVFSCGWITTNNGQVFIYYGSSDTRIHVATSTIERLLDYVINTPPDPLRSYACVEQRNELITKNLELLNG